MMSPRHRVWFPLILACSGCASAPVNYYTLLTPPTSPHAERPNTCCVVEIRSVRIPAEVDRPELVVRRSDEQVAVLSNDLWIAPLRDEVRSAILNDIREKLPLEPTLQGTNLRTFVISLDITRFESQPARYALIEAEWRVVSADGPKRATPMCKTFAQVDVEAGVSGLVQGYQKAISRVASSVTISVLAAEQGTEVQCPSQKS
jgi:uncharacterized protein